MHFSLSSVGQVASFHSVTLISMTTEMALSLGHGFQGCPRGSHYASHTAEERKNFREQNLIGCTRKSHLNYTPIQLIKKSVAVPNKEGRGIYSS